jgi:hypothetical protein
LTPCPPFIPGLELSRLFYTEAVRPLLGDLPHTAARVGAGSDVLGYDSARSTDHDWGPRLDLFLTPGDAARHGPDLSQRLAHHLPKRFHGWSTHFEAAVDDGPVRVRADTDGPVAHMVRIGDIGSWCHAQLGFDPRDGVTLLDWLATPWQRLAEVTGGAVFHDGLGLGAVRAALAWYPDDVWRHVLAAQWTRIAQEEAFVARTAEAGDDLGSRMVAARMCREAARLCLLLGRRWPPYQKWLGVAAAGLPAADHLAGALRAGAIEAREAALCAAYEQIGAAQNALGLAAAVPATRRPYHSRPYAVIGADRFADALVQAIQDPSVRALPPVGSIDQLADSTDVLVRPPLCRAIIAPTMIVA